MEIQLEEIIRKIKTEGIKSAQDSSEQIVENARQQADTILRDAKKKAEDILSAAREKIARETAAGKEALNQAGRDLLILLEKAVRRVFSNLLETELAKNLKGDVLIKAIQTVMTNWKPGKENQDISILLSAKDADQLTGSLLAALKETAKTGITVKPVKGLENGFKISIREGAVYYDFSVEQITDLLLQILNPRFAAIIRKNAGEE